MKSRAMPFVVSLLLFGVSCATTGALREDPLDEGVVRVYENPIEETVEAGREAMVGSGIEVKEVKKLGEGTWMIMGNKKGGFASYGELVRMVFEGDSAGPTTVRIVTKKRLATNVLAEGDWSRSIYDQMDLSLEEASP